MATDDFDRANGTLIVGNWALDTVFDGDALIEDGVATGSGDMAVAYRTDSATGSSKVTHTEAFDYNNSGPVCCWDGNGSGYIGDHGEYLIKATAGSLDYGSAGTGSVSAAGDTSEIKREGSDVVLYVNDVETNRRVGETTYMTGQDGILVKEAKGRFGGSGGSALDNWVSGAGVYSAEHRYWRLRLRNVRDLGSSGGTYGVLQVQQFQFFFGDDLIDASGATITDGAAPDGGAWNAGSGEGADKLFATSDSNKGVYIAGPGSPIVAEVLIDFGTPVAISQVSYITGNDNNERDPTAVAVAGGDDEVDYTTYVDVSGETITTSRETETQRWPLVPPEEPSGPVVDTVDTDDVVNENQANPEIAGTGIDDPTVTFEQYGGAVVKAQTVDSWDGTNIVLDGVDMESGSSHLGYGTTTARVTNVGSPALSGTRDFTLSPRAGRFYVVATTPFSDDTQRIKSSADIIAGNLVEISGTTDGVTPDDDAPANLVVNTNLTFYYIGATITEFLARVYDHVAHEWGAWELQTAFISGSDIELVVADTSHAQGADAVALVQANTLAPADSSHAHTADAVVLVQQNTIAPSDALHGLAVDAPALVQQNTVAVQEAVHAQTVDAVVLVQANTLAPADATHDHTADSLSLSGAGTLAPADATHGHTADALALVQANTLAAVADAVHGHTADALSLSQGYALLPADAVHSLTVDTVALEQANTLAAVADGSHAHTADAVALAQQHVLAPAETTHANTADAVVLLPGGALGVDDALHAHTADLVALTQANTLATPDKATHGHAVDALVLLQDYLLAVADALHDQTADAVVVDTVLTLAVVDTSHALAVDALALVQANVLAVADALHDQTADTPLLDLSYALAVAKALHGHTADAVLLTQQAVLVVQDALHAHGADTVPLNQHYVLVVNDALHALLSDNVVFPLARFETPPERHRRVPAINRVVVAVGGVRTVIVSASPRLVDVAVLGDNSQLTQ